MDLEAPQIDYDVFLSFRGPDTRQGFTDVLYDHMVRAGIRVFRDDDELMVGDQIKTILQAINNSQLCVPIFSETFASSKWCLREVKRMVRLNKAIVPIFCNVSSDDVKLKTQTYQVFMEEHETKYGRKRVEKWKDALKAAAQFKGREVLNQRYTDFCEEFISQVLVKLGPREQLVVDHLIGVENQLEDFTELLNIESAGVRYIGIHGMGGIGKTSLAKVIFNKFSPSFDSCSFIENVREKSLDINGLSQLEKELRGNLYPRYKGGFNSSRVLNPRFHRKKVLVVLDDVDKCQQIERLAGKSSWFGPGSRIIVTTRNINVLTKCGTLKADEIFPFEMETLEPQHALQLFSRYAFMKNSPPSDFWNLSEKAVSTTGNLPLALIVMSSILRNEEKDVWKDVIARSKEVPIKEVKDRLKISYDKLEDHQKQIFLDIACFQICKEKTKVIHMWEDSKFFPIYGLAVLKSMSLIKIIDNCRIWMHDQLRDLGRDIVRGESVHSRKRSRLWEHDDALQVLMSKRKKENVQALCLDKSCKVTLTQMQLDTFENLRLLQLGEVKFKGDLDNLLPKLRWLSWIPPSKFGVANFRITTLVTLDLSKSLISESWHGWSLLQQGAKNLKDLILVRCFRLTRTPDFPKGMILERLILLDCWNLATVHASIGNLKCLKHLDLCYCMKLAALPKELRELRSLVKLDLACTRIVRLPKSIGALTELEQLSFSYSAVANLSSNIGALRSLVSLKLSGSKIVKLPSSIIGLEKLQILLLDYTKIKELPNTLGELKSLVNLDVQGTSITELPDGICRLRKLERLALSDCSSLAVLPPSIGNIKSLTELHLSGTAITKLPDSIGRLERLKELRVEGCKLRKLPSWFGALGKLEELHAGSNLSLKVLPRAISSLSYLRILDISGSSIRKLPPSISQFSLLKILVVEKCDWLRELPELPKNLNELSVTSRMLQKVPDFSRISNLVHLKLCGGDAVATSNLHTIEKLFKLQSLELCLGLPRGACLPSSFS